MVYGTGGLAWGSNEIGFGVAVRPWAAGVNASNTHLGWTVGGGVEWALLDNWTAKVEYLYVKLDNETYFANTAGNGLGFNADLDVHTVKVGLNYRFGYGKARSSRVTDLQGIDLNDRPSLKAPASAGAFSVLALRVFTAISAICATRPCPTENLLRSRLPRPCARAAPSAGPFATPSAMKSAAASGNLGGCPGLRKSRKRLP